MPAGSFRQWMGHFLHCIGHDWRDHDFAALSVNSAMLRYGHKARRPRDNADRSWNLDPRCNSYLQGSKTEQVGRCINRQSTRGQRYDTLTRPRHTLGYRNNLL